MTLDHAAWPQRPADRIVGRDSFRIEVPDEAAMASLKTLAIVFYVFLCLAYGISADKTEADFLHHDM
jgi:hypothetical protein